MTLFHVLLNVRANLVQLLSAFLCNKAHETSANYRVCRTANNAIRVAVYV